MKKFPRLASRNSRRTERKHIPHFAHSQTSSPYNPAIRKLIIIEEKKNRIKKYILRSTLLEDIIKKKQQVNIGTPRNENKCFGRSL